MKKLLAIGDSFTYGDELATPVIHAWPYLFAKRIGYEVVNLGVNASGNTKMLRYLLEQNINEFDLIVIAWSGFDRIEFADDHGTFETWPGALKKSHRIPHEAASFRGELIEYITRYHNDDYLYKQYLVNIILAQSYLKLHKKKYIMLDAFLNNQGDMKNRHQELVKQIDTEHFLGWPNETMLEWAADAPKGQFGHFLELGHSRVAEKIYQHLISTFKE
jgi:hypothetical protein